MIEKLKFLFEKYNIEYDDMKLKKLLAIILTLVMLLSALSVVASAAGEQVITPYEKIEVTASDSLNPVFKFVSEETRTYFVDADCGQEAYNKLVEKINFIHFLKGRNSFSSSLLIYNENS